MCTVGTLWFVELILARRRSRYPCCFHCHPCVSFLKFGRFVCEQVAEIGWQILCASCLHSSQGAFSTTSSRRRCVQLLKRIRRIGRADGIVQQLCAALRGSSCSRCQHAREYMNLDSLSAWIMADFSVTGTVFYVSQNRVQHSIESEQNAPRRLSFQHTPSLNLLPFFSCRQIGETDHLKTKGLIAN